MSDTRSQAIECLTPVVFSDWQSSQEENAAEVYDALIAAGFEILAPGELEQVGERYVDERRGVQRLYVRTTRPDSLGAMGSE